MMSAGFTIPRRLLPTLLPAVLPSGARIGVAPSRDPPRAIAGGNVAPQGEAATNAAAWCGPGSGLKAGGGRARASPMLGVGQRRWLAEGAAEARGSTEVRGLAAGATPAH